MRVATVALSEVLFARQLVMKSRSPAFSLLTVSATAGLVVVGASGNASLRSSNANRQLRFATLRESPREAIKTRRALALRGSAPSL